MPAITDAMVSDPSRGAPPPADPKRPLWRRLLWFALLWALGVGVVSAVAYGIRLWIMPG
ncbi:MAG: DUF2474 domain-containing protein [Hyphomicrobium sp.]|uniref:DUF2474 domain-containing protein n=1 Tax=Hyphomicrobium sp. TaxID=82 RepID=UPI003D0B437F